MQSLDEQEKTWLGLLLAWIAGGVDAVGFLVLLGIFTSHMTGNTSHTGINLAQAHWSALLQQAFPIPLFFFGVMLGAMLTEAGIRRVEPRMLSLIMAIEAALLLGCLLYGDSLIRGGRLQLQGGWRYYLLLALPPLAMGMQNVSVRRAGGRAIHTTYITGALTNAAESAVLYLFWLRDETRHVRGGLAQALRASRRQPSFDHFIFHGAIWCAYVAGATVAGLAEQRLVLNALILPLAGLAIAICWNLLQPIYQAPRSVLEENASST